MTNPGGTIATEAGHWYKPDHSPFYTYINKHGEEKNVTLREARKVGAAPSVSAIMGCASSWALTNYFIQQRLSAAATEPPRGPEEGLQAYMDRIDAKAREHSETARDLGTEIHGAIERALVDTVWIPRPEAHAAIQTLGEWCGLDGLRPERSFFHPLGYGGKCDVHKKPEITIDETHNGFLADFKTKDFTEANLRTYENHAMQLAAYREGFDMPQARCAIIYVSTSVPGLTHLVELEEKELQRGWEMFCALLQYWQLKNRYVPTCELAKELA
jgi:hypothetical protein